MPDGVVWLPTNAAGVPVRRELAAAPGSVVRVAVATGEIEREATA
jgi:hypothetical protein